MKSNEKKTDETHEFSTKAFEAMCLKKFVKIFIPSALLHLITSYSSIFFNIFHPKFIRNQNDIISTICKTTIKKQCCILSDIPWNLFSNKTYSFAITNFSSF